MYSQSVEVKKLWRVGEGKRGLVGLDWVGLGSVEKINLESLWGERVSERWMDGTQKGERVVTMRKGVYYVCIGIRCGHIPGSVQHTSYE